MLAKKMQSRFDDLLAKALFLAFAKTSHLPVPRSRMTAPCFGRFAVLYAAGHRRA
jgi:hypothetical protein